MGNFGGKYLRLIPKPFKDFNLESRIEKHFVKEEKTRIANINKQYPKEPVNDEPERKIGELLRDVYVESHKTDYKKLKTIENSPIKKRVALKDCVEFINNHQIKPKIHTVAEISKQFQIDEAIIRNILTNFRLLEQYVPNEKNVKAIFVGPAIGRTVHSINERKRLPSGIKLNQEKDN